jgi:hypothetical protein
MHLTSRRDVVAEEFVSHSSYDRAKKAISNFRDPGVNGRPNKLTKEEQRTLLSRVLSISTSIAALSASEVRDEVCLSPLFCSFSIPLLVFLGQQNHTRKKNRSCASEASSW